MPFVNSTTGRDPAINTRRPNPYIVSAADAYRGRIEAAKGVTITVQHNAEDGYWFAYANRDRDDILRANGYASRTAASATAKGEFTVLDRIARQLNYVEPADTNIEAAS